MSDDDNKSAAPEDRSAYYNENDLGKFGDIGKDAPDLAKKFFAWYGAVFEKGALTEREKALIALAVAHAVQCPYCIDAYSGARSVDGVWTRS